MYAEGSRLWGQAALAGKQEEVSRGWQAGTAMGVHLFASPCSHAREPALTNTAPRKSMTGLRHSRKGL